MNKTKMNLSFDGTISAVLAFFLSYSAGNSAGWVVFHTLTGPFYLIYYAFAYGGVL